jgi:hypothetical protein
MVGRHRRSHWPQLVTLPVFVLYNTSTRVLTVHGSVEGSDIMMCYGW